MYQQVEERINLTYRELAWQSEKCRLMLDKLKTRFKDVIDCEHVIVYTFDTIDELFVASFRAVTLPKDMEQYKTELEKLYFAKILEKQKNKENIENLGKLNRLYISLLFVTQFYGLERLKFSLKCQQVQHKQVHRIKNKNKIYW